MRRDSRQVAVYEEAGKPPSNPDLATIRAELDRLRKTYTDEHLDVRRRLWAKRRQTYLMGACVTSGTAAVSLILFAILNEHIFRRIMDYVTVYFV